MLFFIFIKYFFILLSFICYFIFHILFIIALYYFIIFIYPNLNVETLTKTYGGPANQGETGLLRREIREREFWFSRLFRREMKS